MDTIQIKLKLLNEGLSIQDFHNISVFINNIKSSNGYTFCDVIDLRSDSSIGIKISYPRFFYGSNVYLIKNKSECFIVQKVFCEALVRCNLTMNSQIYLERVDIPFTYLMPQEFEFYSYNNLYSIMAMVHAEKRIKGSRKMFSDILIKEPETLIYADTKVSSSYNNKIMIYNQYTNVQSKTDSEDNLEIFLYEYPDLKYRMRIEVSKKIKRNPFLIECFSNFDLVENYLPQLKQVALNDLLDFQIIDKIYQDRAIELSKILHSERQRIGFNYEIFILQNISRIYDYEILRKALGIEIDNTKTRESAVTVIRRHLNNYTQTNNIIVMDVYDKLRNISEYIKNFQII